RKAVAIRGLTDRLPRRRRRRDLGVEGGEDAVAVDAQRLGERRACAHEVDRVEDGGDLVDAIDARAYDEALQGRLEAVERNVRRRQLSWRDGDDLPFVVEAARIDVDDVAAEDDAGRVVVDAIVHGRRDVRTRRQRERRCNNNNNGGGGGGGSIAMFHAQH